jgi:hypothetical protein
MEINRYFFTDDTKNVRYEGNETEELTIAEFLIHRGADVVYVANASELTPETYVTEYFARDVIPF